MSSKFNYKFDSGDYESARDILLSRKLNSKVDIPNDSKIERTMNLSNYADDLETYKGTRGIARVILNLLYLKPGTYPNAPYMGINIQKYLFEFLDDITISEIEANINTQIKTYLSSSVVAYVTISKMNDLDEIYKRTVLITITVHAGSDSANYKYRLTQDKTGKNLTVEEEIK